MTRMLVTTALAGATFAATLWLLPFPAHAAGNAPGNVPGPAETEGPYRVTVIVEQVLATVHPGDDMGALLTAFDSDDTPVYRCDLSPCGQGPYHPDLGQQPAPVPLPGSGWLLLTAIAGFVVGYRLVRLMMQRRSMDQLRPAPSLRRDNQH